MGADPVRYIVHRQLADAVEGSNRLAHSLVQVAKRSGSEVRSSQCIGGLLKNTRRDEALVRVSLPARQF